MRQRLLERFNPFGIQQDQIMSNFSDQTILLLSDISLTIYSAPNPLTCSGRAMFPLNRCQFWPVWSCVQFSKTQTSLARRCITGRITSMIWGQLIYENFCASGGMRMKVTSTAETTEPCDPAIRHCHL